MKKLHLKLFLLSFLVLFLELALIRYIPSTIRLVSYFSNLILLGTFLGVGAGALFAHQKLKLISFFPILLASFVGFVTIFRTTLNLNSAEIIFFNQIIEYGSLFPSWILIPILFLFITILFFPLGQEVGLLFKKIRPLEGYTVDILGSLVGVITFTTLSALETTPFIWFVVCSLLFLCLFWQGSQIYRFFSMLSLCITIALVVYSNEGTIWSPYYKINLVEYQSMVDQVTGYEVFINNTSHQFVSTYKDREEFYYSHFKAFPDSIFSKVLIIGAGTGSDVATTLALGNEVTRIDAVDIDPQILKLGKSLNHDKPFDDPRVHTFVDDGRSFMQNSTEKYDLIIFALPDSLTSASHSDNVRLESFLFTRESFELAKSHLSENGLFVLYNYYRKDWLIDRIVSMMNQVFETPSMVRTYSVAGKPATIMNGPKIKELKNDPFFTNRAIPPMNHIATDDWPFLYLRNNVIPQLYFPFLFIVITVTILLVFLIKKNSGEFRLDIRFFFMGAAFMLLETKSLVIFSLLFGNTWIVNSIVICGVLLSVLLANAISTNLKIKKMRWLYLLLIISLALQYFVPTRTFLSLHILVRLFVSVVFYFSPIFFANLIFSQQFRDKKNPEISFGSNLLGAVIGGILEYLSLLLGFKFLILIIIFLYILSFVEKKQLYSFLRR